MTSDIIIISGSSAITMDPCRSNESCNNGLLDEETVHNQAKSSLSGLQNGQTFEETIYHIGTKNESHKLNSAVWTTHATSSLLKLYEEKLEMLVTPKKKTRIWIAISEDLRNYNIDVTPDQVRWKINALTKKYKHCIDMGRHEKFKYFKEMDNIYVKYNVDCDSFSITEYLSKKRLNDLTDNLNNKSRNSGAESRAMIEMRKARLARRINCDRFQGKIKLERQWLEYLHKKEEHKQLKDKIFERKLELRKEMLETWTRELEMKHSLAEKQLQIMENKQNELIAIEQEKCELLKQILHLNLKKSYLAS